MKKYIRELGLDTAHFTGMLWIEDILVKESYYQSHKLRQRLFVIGIKIPACEECGWAKRISDGRLPLELDHINGDHLDNRLENLRILCPNYHSLKPTHRRKKTQDWINKLPQQPLID